MRDDSTTATIMAAISADLSALITTLLETEGDNLGSAEQVTRQRLHQVGATLLERCLAARGTGKAGARVPCSCGAAATFEGYRSKDVQTLVGWIRVRRAYYHCGACGQSHIPLDSHLGLERDGHSPHVRRLASHLGALLPFGQAAATLGDLAGIGLSASSVRGVTERVGQQQEAAIQAAVRAAWTDGLPEMAGPGPERLYLALDGVRILTTDGAGKEAKVGVLAAESRQPDGTWRRDPSHYVVSFDTAAVFGQRLALAAHRAGLEQARELVVLGDGAEWIWNLAAEHAPQATCIVDWYHASERIWQLGRTLYGEGTARTRRWVARQLDRLAAGRVRHLARAWQRLRLSGAAAAARDEQVTYFSNQASRMAYDQYRTRGLDIGSGMVESACKTLIGMREKGPGMRWTVAGAQAVANVRVRVFTHAWADDPQTPCAA
jgi:hypothetical protein